MNIRLSGNHNSVNRGSVITPTAALGKDALITQGTLDRHQATDFNTRNQIKISTWNVRSLHQKGKLENVKLEMGRLKVQILGISETRWTKSGSFRTEDCTMYYSGGDEHERGVGILLNKTVANSVVGFWSVSDRIALVKLKAKPFNINVIQSYAPTSASTEEELEEFYEELDKCKKECKDHEVNIVMGDFNAKVGRGRNTDIVGSEGLGEMNRRGEKLMEWCEQNDQIIMNTWFTKHPRKLWTWKSPDGITRNQIDYITVNRRFRNSIRDILTHPEADCNSDHNMLVGKIKVKLQRLKHHKFTSSKLDLKSLEKEKEVKEKFYKEVEAKMEKINENQCVEQLVKVFQTSLKEAAKTSTPNCPKKKHKPWITPEILELMNERRKVKNNITAYKNLDREVRNACQKAKETLLNNQCQDIEELEKKNPQLMHTKIKEATRKYKTCSSANCIEANDDTIIMEKEKVLERWKEYICELFEDNRPPEYLVTRREKENLPILKEEIVKAIKSMPKGKAAGPDEVFIELIQALDDLGAEWMTKIANKIYEEGHFPTDMSRSVFITLPKKAGTTKCELHRTISLMSHMTKVILKILLQ